MMARSADGSLRDAMSLLEQARAYCGTAITEAQVRSFLGVVSAEVLDELVGAIEARSAQRANLASRRRRSQRPTKRPARAGRRAQVRDRAGSPASYSVVRR